MTNKKLVAFSYGALEDETLEEQARKQGYTLGEDAEFFERLREALNLVTIHGIITWGESDKAYPRLQNMVISKLKELKEGENDE